MSEHSTNETDRCDGCEFKKRIVQTVDVYDDVERYCIACAEVPA